MMAEHVLFQHCPVTFPWTILLGLLSHRPAWGVTLIKIKINKLIIMMFHGILNTKGIFPKTSYTVWNTSLILSHPPSLLGHCPKFDRIFFLMASLSTFRFFQKKIKIWGGVHKSKYFSDTFSRQIRHF